MMYFRKLIFILAIVLIANACTKQLTIDKDNIMGVTNDDVIAYLESYQEELNSDSLAEVIKIKEQYMNDIRGWSESMEKADSSFKNRPHHTDTISLNKAAPLLNSVLTEAIHLLQKEKGTDYLALMENNWENFTILGPKASSIESYDLLLNAYAPYYWASYATIEKDTTAFFNALLNKLELIHFQARSVSMLHNPPVPFYSYFITTQLGMQCYMNMEKYKDALQWGDTYLTDLLNWDFVRYDDLYEVEAFDIHMDILNRMQYCYLQIGDESSARQIDDLKQKFYHVEPRK